MIALDSNYDPLAWGSHLAPLMSCLGRTFGPVLEIGVGHFSTPILSAYCRATQRHLVSVESDLSWAKIFEKYAGHSRHNLIHGNYDDVLPQLAKQQWDIVFIDHSPGGPNRAEAFELFIRSGKYVVVHDFHGENEEAIKPLLNANIYKELWSDYSPPTLVASLRYSSS